MRSLPASYQAASRIISLHRDAIVGPHDIGDWDELYLTPASVLVSIRHQ